MHRTYWDEFYAGAAESAVVQEPSPFARWAASRQLERGRLIDVGTGTGRDGLWFAAQGYQVVGLDYSPQSIALASSRARERQVRARFEQLDLYDPQAVRAAARRFAKDGPNTVYARFLLHAIEDTGRANLYTFAREATAGGPFLLEFRTGKDAHRDHVFGDHFRLFLDADLVVDELEAHGAEVVFREEGHGLAIYRDEDPHVARLEARWS